jgi:CRISPR-associated protein Cas1
MYRVETAIETVGLDPMAGFLHISDYGKNALTFDLAEEFRTPFVDTICCSLFNLNTLASHDFEQKAATDIKDALFNPNEGEAPAEKIVLLTRDGLKKVIPVFEKKMENKVQYQRLDNPISLNTIIMEQVKHLKRMLLDEEKEYKGFLYR